MRMHSVFAATALGASAVLGSAVTASAAPNPEPTQGLAALPPIAADAVSSLGNGIGGYAAGLPGQILGASGSFFG
ncbi:hypothetical protein [Streptomyces chryseus]